MPRPFEILPLVERTAPWWEWRRTGIGSADAPIIMGDRRGKTAERLLAEKQDGSVIARDGFVRERGAALERAARLQYALALGLTAEPACVVNVARPWQRASLDGLSCDGEHVVEIKCGQATYQRAATRQRPARHHFAQLQHLLSVTGMPVVDYWCHWPGHPPLRLEVRRDERYLERLIAAEEVFARQLTGGRPSSSLSSVMG